MSPRQSGNSAERKALLAEAKAWRVVARLADDMPLGESAVEANHVITVEVRRRFGEPLYEKMLERIEGHLEADGYTFATSGGVTSDSRDEVVILDLLLALECEDEAAALSSRRVR